MSKDWVAKLNKIRHVFRERDLLFEMNHSFIIKLLSVNMDEDNLNFIFEHCKNGDLATMLYKQKLDIRIVKIYAAQLV